MHYPRHSIENWLDWYKEEPWIKVLTKIYFHRKALFGRQNFFNIFSDMRIMHKVSVLPPHCHCNIGNCGVGFGDFPSQAVAIWHGGKLQTKEIFQIFILICGRSHTLQRIHHRKLL